MKLKLSAMVICVLILLLSLNVNGDEDIGDPSKIPMFDNFSTPNIEPGSSGTFGLTIENRYGTYIENASLTAGIYGLATIDFYKDITEVDRHPEIEGDGVERTFEIGSIKNDTLAFLNFSIRTSENTEEGTYFVRFTLTFDYNGTGYIMKSKGWFTDEEWENATAGADINDPGNIEIDVLGVDGIIPDSSFKVWTSIPVWPLYVCIIPLIVMLGVFALLFYVQEEYNSFPWLDQGFKYWSGKLHQSWRLLKHRFRKA